MKLIVEFSRNNGQSNELIQRLGPYRTVQISAGALWVFDGFQPFVLATEDASTGEWTVNGLEGMTFTSVLIR